MIPKVIHKVCIVDGGKMPKFPDGLKHALETWYRKNPGFKVKMYSGDDCVRYIKDNYDDRVLEAYNRLKPYSYKCDLMRHLIMHAEGGWYSDLRQVCLESLDVFYHNGIKEYYTSTDCPPNQMCLYTAFIGSVPAHAISKKMIDLILWNVDRDHYGLDCLYPTGPGAYMNAAVDYLRAHPTRVMVGLHGSDEHVHFVGVAFVKCKYNGAKGADNGDMPGTNDYGVMWRQRDVYEARN